MISTARLPLQVLLEVRRIGVTCLSSPMHNVPQEDRST